MANNRKSVANLRELNNKINNNYIIRDRNIPKKKKN